MSVTRNNHYVPQWHQRRFLLEGQNELAYLDLTPEMHRRGDGTRVPGRSLHRTPTVRAFVEKDLYSTFFGTAVSDEIERRLFGDIDTRGADAIRAFEGLDQSAWHANFETLFEYLDVQKLRTPKGLAWLSTQYPELSQNQLMMEMQSLRMLNVTTWTTGVREIVSAEQANTKFILTDHPVTVYNYAVSPRDRLNKYPGDPSVALKSSQTIFPLGQDHCLILTNLEYAKDHAASPLEKRTFARRFHNALVNTINFIRTRHLTDEQVTEINFIAKARAHRYIAAGRKEWLYPEETVTKPWRDLRSTLLPPEEGLFHFGGEMYVGYEDGRVDYQDEFGRHEGPRPWLVKPAPAQPIGNRELCPCGSGLSFSACCKTRPRHLRTSWTEKSIRERNLMFLTGIENLLELDGKDWDQIRRSMTDEKIATLYDMYSSLWPRETDLLALLPKPDGTFRSVFTGSLHPKLISEFALGAPLYFGEIIIQHPFVNPMSLKEEMRPTQDPHAYRGEVLKSLMTFFNFVPLVQAGLVHLIPDPWDFDLHLRDQTMKMAEARRPWMRMELKDDVRLDEIVTEDMRRMMLGLPDEAHLSRLAELSEANPPADTAVLLRYLEQERLGDPLAVLQERTLGAGGQLNAMQMAPNFEMTMYLAQATGAQILTDSPFRWRELQLALSRRYLGTAPALKELQAVVQASPLRFPIGFEPLIAVKDEDAFTGITAVFDGAHRYLRATTPDKTRPNYEAQLAARFSRNKSVVDAHFERNRIPHTLGKITSMFRLGGLQDNHINRLLLMSSSEHHLDGVPMATFVQRWSNGK